MNIDLLGLAALLLAILSGIDLARGAWRDSLLVWGVFIFAVIFFLVHTGIVKA